MNTQTEMVDDAQRVVVFKMPFLRCVFLGLMSLIFIVIGLAMITDSGASFDIRIIGLICIVVFGYFGIGYVYLLIKGRVVLTLTDLGFYADFRVFRKRKLIPWSDVVLVKQAIVSFDKKNKSQYILINLKDPSKYLSTYYLYINNMFKFEPGLYVSHFLFRDTIDGVVEIFRRYPVKVE